VRVIAPPPDRWREGRLVALDSGRLVLSGADFGPGGTVPYAIPFSAVRRLEVRRPPSHRRARAVGFGLLGGMVGALAGAVLGHARDDLATFIYGSSGGGLVGIVVGGVVGANSGDRWKPAALPAPGAP
jgi:hypothetical protein